jgi:hypothetical protein
VRAAIADRKMAGLYINPETHDIMFETDGSVKLTNSPATELLLAIGIDVNTFHGDPEQGSVLKAQ